MQLGADVEQLDTLGDRLATAGASLTNIEAVLHQQLAQAGWVGPDATALIQRWTSHHGPMIRSSALLLIEAGKVAHAQADQQRRVSNGYVGTGGSTAPTLHDPGTTPDGKPGDSAVDEALEAIEKLLKALGLSEDAILFALKALRGFKPEVLKQLGSLLAKNPGLLDALKMFDKVVGGATAVLDFMKDFLAHPGLSMDERIIHALVVAGAAFAESAGFKKLGQIIGSAIGSVALPGGGTLAGGAIGFGAGWALGKAFEALDDHLHINERAADLVTSAYHEIKEAASAVADTIKDGVENTIDGAENIYHHVNPFD